VKVERETLVQAILLKPAQPTLEDAVSLMKFESIRSVSVLFEVYEKLRVMWVDKRLG